MTVIHYYTRTGCHLCEVMLEELLPMTRGRLDVEICDIDTRAEWLEKYDTRVPVVDYQGQPVSEYPLNVGAIRELLRRMPENSQ